jgi:hypothetical protein
VLLGFGAGQRQLFLSELQITHFQLATGLMHNISS